MDFGVNLMTRGITGTPEGLLAMGRVLDSGRRSGHPRD